MFRRMRAWLAGGFRHATGDKPAPWSAVVVFATALCAATIALVALGYVATREWRRGTSLLVERRAAEALALATSAMARDMKGAWTTLIVPINQLSIQEDPPYNLLQPVARAFARFPYPESLIVWTTATHPDGVVYAFNRADRRPMWDAASPSADPFPVVLVKNPPALQGVVSALQQETSATPFVYHDAVIDGAPYHVVAHLLFETRPPHRLTGVVAFTVNMEWLRNEYFGPLLSQVARIGGNENVLAFSLTDQDGRSVAGTPPPTPGPYVFERRFPLLFLEPALVPSLPVRASKVPMWSVKVAPTSDDTLLSALQSAGLMFVLLAMAAAVSMLALFLTVRAVRASAVAASMESEFVATVTHELKTPLAVIRLVGDTLSQNRYKTVDTIREYAELLSEEASRLSQTIDGLLNYAKHSTSSNGRGTPHLPTDAHDLVEEALEQFRPTLERLDFHLTVELPDGLPRVLADRAAMIQVLENVIDNAIKYAGTGRELRITGRLTGDHVQLTVSDGGVGIHPDDLPHVFERFYRGRNANERGSGLGLAISEKVVKSHGGRIEIRSTLDVGTEITVLLQAAHRV